MTTKLVIADIINSHAIISGHFGMSANTKTTAAVAKPIHSPFTEKAFAGEGDHKGDLQNLYQSLRDCRCFISNNYFGDARGFRFQAENKRNQVEVGGELIFDKYTHIHVNLPQTAVVHLIKDGSKYSVQKGESLVFKIEETGCYRVEAYSYDRPWIFSNHIRIR